MTDRDFRGYTIAPVDQEDLLAWIKERGGRITIEPEGDTFVTFRGHSDRDFIHGDTLIWALRAARDFYNSELATEDDTP